jgi:hypothetical protein
MTETVERLRLINYALLQTIIGPSLVRDLFVFMYFIRHGRKQIVNAPQNHVVLCLLLVSFTQKITDLPLSLYFL